MKFVPMGATAKVATPPEPAQSGATATFRAITVVA